MVDFASDTPRGTRRQGSKASRIQAVSKIKKNLHLSPEAIQRLGIQAVMTGRSESQLVDELILEHFRRFVVQDRGGRVAPAAPEPAAVAAA